MVVMYTYLYWYRVEVGELTARANTDNFHATKSEVVSQSVSQTANYCFSKHEVGQLFLSSFSYLLAQIVYSTDLTFYFFYIEVNQALIGFGLVV